jgi:hypothetical protein
LGSPASPQSGGRIAGPSGGEVVGAGVGVGAAIVVGAVVAVNHAHHTLKGCVFNGQSGLKLKTSDSKVFSIEAEGVNIKVGDTVKVHGSKVNKTKDANGDQIFKVDKVSRDYGSCSVDAQSSSGTH